MMEVLIYALLFILIILPFILPFIDDRAERDIWRDMEEAILEEARADKKIKA